MIFFTLKASATLGDSYKKLKQSNYCTKIKTSAIDVKYNCFRPN